MAATDETDQPDPSHRAPGTPDAGGAPGMPGAPGASAPGRRPAPEPRGREPRGPVPGARRPVAPGPRGAREDQPEGGGVRTGPPTETDVPTGSDTYTGTDTDTATGTDADADAGSGPEPAAGGAGGRATAGPVDPGARMPRWLPRAVLLVLALYACFQLGSWAFHQLIGLLVNVLIAFFLALAIEPAVARMAARGMRRGLATFLVFFGVFVAAVGFVVLLGSMLAAQIIDMIADFPGYLDDVIDSINSTFHTELSRLAIQDSLLHSDWLQKYVQNSASGVLDVSTTVLGGLFKLLTIGLFAFYFAADGPRLRRALCSVLPPAKQAEVLRAWEIAVAKTGGYLYSRGLMALISGIAHYILFAFLDVAYAPALAVWVGLVSQFIPTIGTYLAGALPMLIAFTVHPWYALYVLGFVVVYQQFENYVLQPKLTAKTVDIHPAVAFGSVIAGTALLGAVGALIAIPAVATLQAFLGAYVKRYAVADEVTPGRRTPRVRRPRAPRPPGLR